MKSKIETIHVTNPWGAILAPLAGIGTFSVIITFCFIVFSNDKTALPLSFFVAAAAGIYVGRLGYKSSLQQVDRNATAHSGEQDDFLFDSRRSSTALGIWAMGLAFQILAYLTMCVLLGVGLRLLPEQFGYLAWFGFNLLIFISMLFSWASIFWIHSGKKCRIGHLFWSLVLFVILYLSFHYLATWLADPYTIPGKLEW